MKRSISIIGSILLAAALTSPAWAHPGKGKGGGQSGGGSGGSGGSGGESQAGGLPGLEDRVEADEALITTLQMQVSTLMGDVTLLQGQVATLNTEVGDLEGQNNFAVVNETTTTCTLVSSSSSAGPVSTTFITNGICAVTFGKDVSLCSAVATIRGLSGFTINVVPAMTVISGDTVEVTTTSNATETAAAADFNLTVTCP